MTELLDLLLDTDPTPAVTTIQEWKWHHDASGDDPLTVAVLGGFRADRLGFAFASGYQAACRRLVPDAPDGWLLALCATEAGGNHPRSIHTSLRDGRLTGEKRFVSMGTMARGLLVVASRGPGSDGRNRLSVALVDAQSDGVVLTDQPTLRFVPEVPHAGLVLEDAAPARLLPGDGYSAYLKPFRTIEDIHVNLAILAYLVGLGRRSGLAPEAVESLLVLLCALAPLSTADAKSRSVHRALGGVLTQAEAVIGGLDLEAVGAAVPDEWARFQRDRMLMKIAGKARAARLIAARR